MEPAEPIHSNHESSQDANRPAVSMPPTSAGGMLFGRYQVVREIGRGGMGVVLLARDCELNVDVAIKLVPDLLVQDREGLDELKHEVLRGMALTHPHIVRTHGFARDATMAAIIMEYVDGGNFIDLKRAHPGGCLDASKLLPWLEQLCPVLDYAHFEIQIAHRDLKPHNLMYTTAGRLKVADFGISSMLNDTVSRVSMRSPSSGTPAYMSPQQIMGERASHLDDVYALGATLYELLTGKPPFYKGQVLAQVLDCQPGSMAARREELGITGKAPIPDHWEETVAACLAKEPSHRPQSAGEVLDRLKSASLVNRAVTPPPPAKPKRRAQRSQFISRWIIVSLVLVLATAAFAYVQIRQPAKPTEQTRVLPPPPTIPTAIPSPPPEPPEITSPDELPTARAGEPYHHKLDATEGTPPYSWRIDGSPLAVGLELDENGLISGIPATPGTSEFHVKVTGSDGLGARKAIKLTTLEKPAPPPPDPIPAEVPRATAASPAPPATPAPPASLEPLPAAAQDAPYLNSLGMRFVPAGTPDVLCSVWLTRVQDFRAFVEATRHDAKKDVFSVEIGGRFGLFPRGDYWEKPGFAQSDEHPVCGVSWNDAKAFCKWLTEKERKEGKFGDGFEYRLPTDAEWISALGISSPGAAIRYPWGTTWPPPEGRGNLAGLELRDGGVTPKDWPKLGIRDDIPRTSRVDRFPANSFGIHDSFGNLWQFCEDTTDAARNRRLLRGGSWGTSDSDELRLDVPAAKDRTTNGRAVDAGFRCVLARSR